MKIDKIHIIGFFLSLFLLTACGSDSEPSIPKAPDPSEESYPEVTESERASIPVSLQKRDHVQICAHRGYWKDAPENSIKAVTLAIENKIDMIELDVRMSKDGKLVLMHDATIERTTNGTGKVSELSYKELSSYNLYHDGELTEERIPLFKDILSAARGKIYIDIDVKISDYKAVYNMVCFLKYCLRSMTWRQPRKW